MSLELITDELFQEHIKKANRQFYEQSPQMARHLAKRGYDVKIVGYEVEGDVKVSGVLFSSTIAGGLHMELHNGPVFTDPRYLKDFFQELKQFAKKLNVLELVVKPFTTYQTFDSYGNPTCEPRDLIIKDLIDLGYQHQGLQVGFDSGDWYYLKDLSAVTVDTLTASFSKNGIRQAKKGHELGIKIKSISRDELDLFHTITSATSKRQGFEDKDLEYYKVIFDTWGEEGADFLVTTINFQEYKEKISEIINQLQAEIKPVEAQLSETPDKSKLKTRLNTLQIQIEAQQKKLSEAERLVERYGNQETYLSAGLFVYLDKEAYYLHGGSYPEFSSFPAPTLLQEYVMKKAITKGIYTYNFLCFSGLFDGKDGVLRFKQNFNGYIMRTPGVFTYLPRPYKYQFYQLIKKFLRRS
ncbi:TPA: peptidoglycan bridge formation glycyltransferase FemA/FemB family protein [Streptococcus suis]|uniref:peptidoglycan bridge formation glycyltransferase FemA/FemB family protein n=1 Tax=Streptococcus sp. A18 TaxID=3373125 RepID=UPI003708616D